MKRAPLARVGQGVAGSGRVWNSTLKPGKALERGGQLRATVSKRKPAQPRAIAGGKSFPAKVAGLIEARDQWCVFCGSPFNLHHHHRRLKGSGGDPRPHTQCACNGVMLCAAHHGWIHDAADGRRVAEAEGLIIPRSTEHPASAPVLVHTEGGGLTLYPSCDAQWSEFPPGEVAA